MLTGTDNAAGRYIRTRPINREVASDHNFKLARRWLKERNNSHRDCAKPAKAFMPARLVQIDRAETEWRLRLYSTSKQRFEPYTALSYCWGGNQHVKTTQDTIQRWEDAIPWQMLPKTIQDAVVTTYELGYRHLWVDSLCIIQDSIKDASREISMMPQIYSQATVTIAASGAKSVEQGFLHARGITDFPDAVFEILY